MQAVEPSAASPRFPGSNLATKKQIAETRVSAI
jgi:hypothetical protein